MSVDPLYRTFWRRLWAGYVDLLVLAPLFKLDEWIQYHWASPQGRAVWFVFYSALFPAYQIYLHGRFGQTVGKRLLGVKVVDLSGAPLTMWQAFLRDAINLPVAVWSLATETVFISHGGNLYQHGAVHRHGAIEGLSLGLFGLELVSTLGSSKRRAVHDLVAGSVVIRVRKSESARSADVPIPRSVTSGEFVCPTCGNPVRVGASHCHACDQSFIYKDGRPSAGP
jgi:uncharacterized RDD family membrane protein YckC